MRQREKFISSFRKTTSLFVVVVIGFFLASFLSIFFSLCRLNLRRNYAHVLAKHFVRFGDKIVSCVIYKLLSGIGALRF